MMTTEDVTRVLDAAGVEYEVLPHAHTESALAEAEALSVAPEDVGKTLVVGTPAGNVRAVLPASERVDLGKLADVLGSSKKKLDLLSEETLARDYPEFDLGAVPPFAGGHRDSVVVDRRLADRGSVVVEAGTHDASVRLSTDDLVRVTGAQVADISREQPD